MHLGRRRDVICLLLTAAAAAATTTRRRRLRRMCFLTTFGRSPPHLRHPFSHKQSYVVIIIHEGKYPLETRNGFYFIIVDYGFGPKPLCRSDGEKNRQKTLLTLVGSRACVH